MPGTVADGTPSVRMSFANNFWGKEDAGVSPLLERMHNAKVTSDELRSFYTARAQIEEEYARKLLNLARKPLGSSESGTLRMSLDVVRGEVESMGKQHQLIAGQMKGELEEPLASFAGGMKERRKIVQNSIEKLLKTKNQQTTAVNKARDRFEQDCLKIKGYLAQGHMVMGQEERKNKAKLEKTQIQMSANSSEYEAAVKVLEETTTKWNREWKASCDKFQDFEEERIDYFKNSLWNFANIASTVCVSDDASCEKIRLSLEDCDVEKDISQFIKDNSTGQEIPDPPKYINFCRGDVDDSASIQGSDDGNYSVAQFQRQTNPTFRSASPQPTVTTQHGDEEPQQQEQVKPPKPPSSIQGEDSFTSRARLSMASSTAPPQMDPYADAPQIPHNPYPIDGMTQFCRMGPPSERSTQPSPTRPASGDSVDYRSEYSAPTTYSSVDPNSRQTSPTKQYYPPQDSAPVPDQQVEKKKSGFFNSPFRRKSTKAHENPISANATPTAKNTWTPATARPTEQSPTKPFAGAHNRSNTWQGGRPQGDGAADPRSEGYQLGIGNNIFDVDSPDNRNERPPPPAKDIPGQVDPIAQALADLKGVAKQASVRTSADRHFGMSTPNPDPRAPHGGNSLTAPRPNTANGRTPPPAYDQPPVQRLGAPQPAHTSRDMQRTTDHYITKNRDMFNPGVPPPRPGSSMGQQRPSSAMSRQMDPAGRSPSPAPPRGMNPRDYDFTGPPPQARSASPRPFHNGPPGHPRTASPRPHPGPGGPPQGQFRSNSPNPYGAAQPAYRPRAQSSSPMKPPQGYGQQRPGGSPGYQGPRAASPNPAYNRGPQGAPHEGMALQLAPVRGDDPYAAARPVQRFDPAHARNRSQSNAPPPGGQRPQFTKSGQPILHFARALYMYQAAIPEELSFGKGDVLAVTRKQDDGWWEAEVTSTGRLGLAPSNYLREC